MEFMPFGKRSDALGALDVYGRPCAEGWPPAPGNFQVGAAGTSSVPLGGDSALIGVYEKLLTDADLAALYQASHPGGGVNVYEHKLEGELQAGSWSGLCEMTLMHADNPPAPGNSGEITFALPVTPESSPTRAARPPAAGVAILASAAAWAVRRWERPGGDGTGE